MLRYAGKMLGVTAELEQHLRDEEAIYRLVVELLEIKDCKYGAKVRPSRLDRQVVCQGTQDILTLAYSMASPRERTTCHKLKKFAYFFISSSSSTRWYLASSSRAHAPCGVYHLHQQPLLGEVSYGLV